MPNPTVSSGSTVTVSQPIPPTADQINNALNQYTNNLALVSENQSTLQQMVNTEAQFFQNQQQDIQNQKMSMNRVVSFNQSFTKKYNEYIRIITTIFITLGIIYGLFILYDKYPEMQNYILIAMIIIGAFASIRVMNIFISIQMRDNMDFDKVSTSPPPSTVATDISGQIATNAKNGNILGALDLGACVGSQCCQHADGNKGTKWSPSLQACVSETFVNKQDIRDNVIPYDNANIGYPYNIGKH